MPDAWGLASLRQVGVREEAERSHPVVHADDNDALATRGAHHPDGVQRTIRPGSRRRGSTPSPAADPMAMLRASTRSVQAVFAGLIAKHHVGVQIRLHAAGTERHRLACTLPGGGGCGGCQRNAPTGAAAYGMPGIPDPAIGCPPCPRPCQTSFLPSSGPRPCHPRRLP